jgi:hypothetical protein
MPVGPTKIKDCAAGFEKQHFAASRGGGSTTVEHDSTVALFTKVNSFFFVLKNQCEKFSFFPPEKLVQLIDFTRIVHLNVNNIFFLFFLKN